MNADDTRPVAERDDPRAAGCAASAEAGANSRCARCGAPFACGAVAGTPRCWCMQLPPLPPEPGIAACLCPACLRQRSGRPDAT